MSMYKIIALIVVAFGVVSCVSAAQQGTPPPSTRPLSVSVRVESAADHTPIVGLWLAARSGSSSLSAKTNSEGVAVLSGNVRADATELYVSPVPGTSATPLGGTPGADNPAAVFKDVSERFAMRGWYRVSAPVDQTSISTTISLHAAVILRGRVVDSSSQPLKCLVTLPTVLLNVALAGSNGRFSLKGVKSGSACEVAIVGLESAEQVFFASVTVPTGQAEVDVGDLAVNTTGQHVPLELTVQNAGLVLQRSPVRGDDRSVALVSRDGLRCFQFALSPTGKAKSWTDGVPQILPGEYYVVPGSVTTTDAAIRLRTYAKAGRATELDQAGVARVTVATEGTTSATVDGDVSEHAIMGLAQ